LNFQVEESIWDEHGVEYREVKPGRKEITTHVSIHTIHLDGLRELYRHFLRLPDGAVVEVIYSLDLEVHFDIARYNRNFDWMMMLQDITGILIG
jgi:hypothetical protein